MATANSNPYSLGHQSSEPRIRCPKSANPGPNAYALTGDGDCLLPLIRSGEKLVCDPDQEPAPGDIVVIWWKDGAYQPLVKRLVFGLPPESWWGQEGAKVMAYVEMLNPPQTLSIPLARVEAVHKVIHVMKQN